MLEKEEVVVNELLEKYRLYPETLQNVVGFIVGPDKLSRLLLRIKLSKEDIKTYWNVLKNNRFTFMTQYLPLWAIEDVFSSESHTSINSALMLIYQLVPESVIKKYEKKLDLRYVHHQKLSRKYCNHLSKSPYIIERGIIQSIAKGTFMEQYMLNGSGVGDGTVEIDGKYYWRRYSSCISPNIYFKQSMTYRTSGTEIFIPSIYDPNKEITPYHEGVIINKRFVNGKFIEKVSRLNS